MRTERHVDHLAEREADLRAAGRRDPGAEILADWLRRQRERLELRLEPSTPDAGTLPLFEADLTSR